MCDLETSRMRRPWPALGRSATEKKLSQMYTGLHVKDSLFLSGFNQTWNFSTDFRIIPSIMFHENPSSGNWVVPWDRDRQTDRHDEANSRFSQFCESSSNEWNNTSTPSYVLSRHSLQQGLQFREQTPKKIPKSDRFPFNKCTVQQ